MSVSVNTIQQSYRRLWTAFADAANAQGLGATCDPPAGPLIANKVGAPTAKALILLPAWPFKALSTKPSKAIDIAVEVSEIFSADFKCITKSTTRVGYFKRNDTAKKKSHPMLELHYDFVTPLQEAHPVFHAQVGASDWEDAKLQEMGLHGPIERLDKNKDYANARIPTAFMGYMPSLVSLAADHLQPENFRGMMKAARLKDESVLDPECALLMNGIISSKRPHSLHWYDERYIVHEWQSRGKYFAAVPVLGVEFNANDLRSLRREVLDTLEVTQSEITTVSGKP